MVCFCPALIDVEHRGEGGMYSRGAVAYAREHDVDQWRDLKASSFRKLWRDTRRIGNPRSARRRKHGLQILSLVVYLSISRTARV